MKKLILSLFGLFLSASASFAQTAPNWTQGYVPSPAEWNAVFAGKQDYLGAAPLLITGGTMTGELFTVPSATSSAGLNIGPGVAPTSPVNGDLWMTSSGLFAEVNGVTIGPLAGAGSSSFTAATPITVTFPSAGVVRYACATCGVTGSPLSQFASTTSAQLAGIISDETGAGSLVFGTSPTITTPTINFATGATSSIGVSSVNTGFTNALNIINGGTSSSSSTVAQLGVDLSAGSNTYGVLFVAGGSSPVASLTTGAGVTGGFTISSGAGPLNITNPILSTPNIGVATGTSLTLSGVLSTGGNITMANGSSLASKDTGGTSRPLIFMFSDNATYIDGGAAGINIRTNNSATTAININTAGVVNLPGTTASTSPTTGALTVTGGVGIGGSLSVGGALLSPTINTPSIVFGTGASSIITASSVNTGFTNLLNVQNGGTVSNTSTIAQILANLTGGTNAFLIMQASGGTSPLATISTGSGLTGGLTINAGAGTLNITSPSINGGTLTGTIAGTPTLSGAAFITRANIVPVAAVSLIGNPTGSSASESAITLGSTLSFSGTTMNCTAMSASQVGCGQPDGSTITIVGGKMVASGGSATAITIASTTIGGGTAGGVLTNTAGVLSNTSAGTIGQGFVSNGGTSPPTFQSGTWTLLATLTGNGTLTALADTTHITSTYTNYKIVLNNVIPGTTGVTCEILVHSGGSFQSTSYLGQLQAAQGTSGGVAQATTTYLPCSQINSVSTAAAGVGVSGEFFFSTPTSSAPKQWTGIYSHGASGPANQIGQMGGFWNSTAVIDGIEVSFGGTAVVSSGTMEIYGGL